MTSRKTLRILGLAVLLGGTSGAQAQKRTFAPLPETIDIKTAPEPSRPPDPFPARLENPDDAARSPREPRTKAIDPRAPIHGPSHVDHSRMYYDAPGDGSLWARGERYKASFDGAGATYFPQFGASQPRHYPHALSPDHVTLDGEPLTFERSAPAVREGDRVVLDHGSFVEEYDLTPQAVEQTFVFASLPRRGDLVVHIPVGSELESAACEDGLEFRSELGHVSYGRAVAIDALGRRAAAATELENGSISIRVDASFLATAALPLVIDPVVSIFTIDNRTSEFAGPDVAYDAGTQHWLVAYVEEYGSDDHDVYYSILDSAGTPILEGYVDLTTDDWWRMSCAGLASAQQCLAVSVVTPSGGSATTVRGRTIQADSGSLSNQFTISGSEAGNKSWPAVGGDPWPSGPSNYCVAYEREFSSTDHDILVRLVGPDGSLSAVNYLSNSAGTYDATPAVSKSNDGNTWMIAWARSSFADPHSPWEGSIWGGRIRYDGQVESSPFQIRSSDYGAFPRVSSPLSNSQRTLVVYGDIPGPSSDWDIVTTVLDGSTILETRDLNTMENLGAGLFNEQTLPDVACDGSHFLVSYYDYRLDYVVGNYYVDELYLSGDSLGLSQTRGYLDGSNSILRWPGPRIAAMRDSWGPASHYLIAWTHSVNFDLGYIYGALFDGEEGGPWNAFCYGDGTGTACPCGNNGGIGYGCANSAHPNGAGMGVSGTASTVHDSVVLHASGMPATATCMFLQGAIVGNAVVFGDGLRCLHGTVTRLGAKTASAGNASYPGPSDPLVSVRGHVPIDGGQRPYQVWYRDSANFCTSATSNISAGVIINWAR